MIVDLDNQLATWRSSSAATPLSRGDGLRSYLYGAKPLDEIRLGPLVYNLGTGPLLPGDVALPPRYGPFIVGPAITLAGMGKDLTTIQSSYLWSSLAACCINGLDASVVRNLTLEITSPTKEQSCAIGIGASVNGAKMLVQSCRVIAHGWGGYNWAGLANSLILDDCEVHFTRHGVTNGTSQGWPSGGLVELTNGCKLFGYSPTDEPEDLVLRGLVGLVNRGGLMRSHKTVQMLTGDPSVKFMAGAWNDPGGDGKTNALTEMIDDHVRLVPNGAKYVHDIWEQTGQIRTQGGSGSAIDGSFVRKAA